MIKTFSDLFCKSWQSSITVSWEIFWKCLETFALPSDNFWRIFGNLWKVFRNLRKLLKMLLYIMRISCYVTKRKLHVAWRYKISLLMSKNVSLICCADLWNIFQHSKRNFVSLHNHVISSITHTVIPQCRTVNRERLYSIPYGQHFCVSCFSVDGFTVFIGGA